MALHAMVVLCIVLMQAHDAEGLTEYVVPLLDVGTDSTYTLVLVNNNNENITVDETLMVNNVTKRTETHTIYGHDFIKITVQLDRTDLMSGSENVRSRFYLSSTDNFTIRVVYYSRTDPHQEGFLAVPNAHLGTNYYVSTFCDLGGYCQIAVASSVSGTTQMYIKLPEVVDEIAVCIGNITWRSKTDTTILLEYPEVLQLETTHDMTGTYIYTDKPVGVVAATRSLESTYHYVEQLVPVDQWGTDFVIRTLGNASANLNGTYGNIIHITASQRKTVVKMSGYPTVELTTSQTIRRRIDFGAVHYIQSSKSVQVVQFKGLTYATEDPFVNPGMTLVPSLQHNTSSTIVACNVHAPISLVAITDYDVTFSISSSAHFIASTEVQVVPYEFYKMHIIETVNRSTVTTNGDSYTAILSCNDEAVFPATLLVLSTPPCVNDVESSQPGDGIDNNCNGKTDEADCYENVLYEASFVPHVDDVIQPLIINGGYRLVKFRVKTCGSIQLEIRDKNGGGLVIHISRASISMYECFDDCSVYHESDNSNYRADMDCNTDYAFYWIRRQKTSVCFGVGPFPSLVCKDNSVISYDNSAGVNFNEIRIGGIMTNATIYYDIIKNDCRNFISDWRCQDLVTNCHEYDDICNDVTYTNWVQTNCQKYCGLCTPDSFGKMFVLAQPHSVMTAYEYSNAIAPTVVIRRDGTMSGIGVSLPDTFEQTGDAETFYLKSNQTRNVTTIYTKGSTNNELFIFSDTDSIVFSSIFTGYDNDFREFSVQPIDALGTEYMLAFFHGPISCTVISPEGTVDIWTFTNTLKHQYIGQAAPYKQNIYLTNLDSTGVVIRASHHVAVFCGSSVNTWTQLPATSTWGTVYHVPTYISRDDIDRQYKTKARIITNSDNTIVTIKGDFDAVYPLYERGDFIDQDLTSNTTYKISANYPILVVLQYYTHYDTDSASSFQILPAETNIMNDPVLFVNLLLTSEIDITVHSSNVSVAAMLNISRNNDLRLYYEVNGEALIACRYVKSSGNLTIFGFSSIKYPDMSMHNVWHLTSGTPGDGIDNDVDGLIDEETVCYTGYGVTRDDYDLDGGFGEDCLEIAVGAQVTPLAPPIEPTCVPMVPGQYCYTECRCPCSWVDNLANYENLTKQEQTEMFATDFEYYKQLLILHVGDLHAHKTTKISADDERQSSTNIGYAGIVMLTLVVVVIVAMDFSTLVKYIQTRRQNAVHGD